MVENIVGRDLSVPVLDLGTIDDFTTSQQERLQGILEGLALSRNESLSADLGMEYGSTSGVLWNRPHIEGFNALRARLIAELAQNSIPFSRALPLPGAGARVHRRQRRFPRTWLMPPRSGCTSTGSRCRSARTCSSTRSAMLGSGAPRWRPAA